MTLLIVSQFDLEFEEVEEICIIACKMQSKTKECSSLLVKYYIFLIILK